MGTPTSEPSFATKLAYLRERAWSGQPLEVIETHMSCVLLTGNRAFKIKKPVLHRFLDYRTVEARRTDCEAEVRLNQRLAPHIYLGTKALRCTRSGELTLGVEGEPVDFLVVMRRLRREDMLNVRIAHSRVTCEELGALVHHFAAFYRSAFRNPIEPARYVDSLISQVQADSADLLDHLIDVRDVTLVTRVRDALLRASHVHHDVLAARGHCVVEGHGDLRPEHVVLGTEPVVIDCVSFNRSLRLVDPMYDLALLGVECELLDARGVGDCLLTGYEDRSGDVVPPAVTAIYRAVRALARARLAIDHLDDPCSNVTKWTSRAVAYLTLAERCCPKG